MRSFCEGTHHHQLLYQHRQQDPYKQDWQLHFLYMSFQSAHLLRRLHPDNPLLLSEAFQLPHLPLLFDHHLTQCHFSLHTHLIQVSDEAVTETSA